MTDHQSNPAQNIERMTGLPTQGDGAEHDRAAGRTGDGRPYVYLDALLTPHRSLTPQGFIVVMSIAAIGGFIVGSIFWLAGAWPVMGFCGAEVGLLYLAFRWNYREGRMSERLVLSDEGLTITRTDPKGRETITRMEPNWLRVEIDDPPRHESKLTLRTHGMATTVGDFLSAPERGEVASALRDAIARYREAPHYP